MPLYHASIYIYIFVYLYIYSVSKKKDTHFQINITPKFIKIKCFQKQSFVRQSLLYLCWKFYKATPKIVNSAMN